MIIAKVNVISPILIDGKWIMSGNADIDLDVAKSEYKKGNVIIVSIDGNKVFDNPCCADC
jgi:hypothetical protein